MVNTQFLASLTPFLRDFGSFAGVKGVRALFLVLLGALVEGFGLLLLIPLLVVVIGTSPATAPMQGVATRLFALASANTRLEKLATLVIVFVALMAARAAIITMRDVTLVKVETAFMQSVRSRLTRRLVAAEWSVIARLRHSRVAFLIGANAGQLNSAIYLLFSDAVALVMLISQAAISIYLSPALSAVVMIMLLIGLATVLPILERARKYGEFVTDANFALLDDLSQFLGALKLAISQNLQGSFKREFESALAIRTEEQVRYSRRQTLSRLAVTTFASLVGAAAVIVGIAVLNMPASVLIALLLIFSRMNGPATQLYVDAQNLAQMLPAYLRIRELETELDIRISPPLLESALPIPEGAIEFRNVSFVHSGEDKSAGDGGVRALSLTLRPGSVVGITGPSGSGKTTFADLLVGLYSPQSGHILIGGTELTGSAVASWRNQISYVAQDPYLFHDTIRRNLLWSSSERDDAELWHALEIAGIVDFVRASARGLETIVGDRGSLLSGGERQRIAIARAILRRPRLLLLDEATNAIDIEAERGLLDRLVALKPRPITVIIAHRPESLECCERVLFFGRGSIVSEERADGVVVRMPEEAGDRQRPVPLTSTGLA